MDQSEKYKWEKIRNTIGPKWEIQMREDKKYDWTKVRNTNRKVERWIFNCRPL